MRKLFFPALLILMIAALTTGCGYYYTVKKGDTIYSIARKYDVDQNELMRQNGIKDPTRLQVGTKLKIPRSQMGAAPQQDDTRVARKDSEPENKDQATKEAVDRVRQKHAVAVVPKARSPIDFIWPVRGAIVRSYGKDAEGRINDGVDIGAPEGAKIVAAADGEVLMSSNKYPSYGNMIVVRHKHDFVTIYAHNRKNYVKQGDKVTQGQTIAEVGSTGRPTTPTVHFEIRRVSEPVNPMQYLPPQ
jgi:murein DD-endopeptidase MepM/ murein hydrolase activator NlpD